MPRVHTTRQATFTFRPGERDLKDSITDEQWSTIESFFNVPVKHSKKLEAAEHFVI